VHVIERRHGDKERKLAAVISIDKALLNLRGRRAAADSGSDKRTASIKDSAMEERKGGTMVRVSW